MRVTLLLVLCGLVGCANQRTLQPLSSSASPTTATRAAETKPVPSVTVTRYELGGYRSSREPAVSRETAVYRSTRTLGSTSWSDGASKIADPTNTYAPASFAPLPPSVELAAELAAQKAITENLRAMSANMLGLEKQARGQFSALVAQSEETAKVQQQLEGERARVRQLEAQLRERLQAPPIPPPVETAAPAPAPTPTNNW